MLGSIMSLGNSERSILVVDPDFKSVDVPSGSLLNATHFSETKGIPQQLADISKRWVALVLSPKVDNTMGMSIVHYCKVHRPTLPIFLLHEGDSPIHLQEAQQLGITEMIKKPVTLADIFARVSPFLVTVDPNQTVANTEELEKAHADSIVTEDDQRFTSIAAEDLLVSKKYLFDFYIRLSSGKYIKVLKSNEPVDSARLITYLKKGVKNFYLKKDIHAKYVTYCDNVARAILKSKTISIQTKLKGTLIHGQETLKFLKDQGLSPSNIQLAQSFLGNVEILIDQIQLKKNPDVTLFFNDLIKVDHGVSCTILAGLLANVMGMQADRAVQVVGMAAMFHDIGLVKLPPECQEDTEFKMTQEQYLQYSKHPLIGAQIIQELPQLDPIVAQAVAQHHERRNRKGYPLHLGPGAINRVAEIVGICDEFLRLMRKPRETSRSTIYSEMEKGVFHGFTFDVVNAFRMIFFPSGPTNQ
jgi:HD-GYP domain-containing protein (c-di-GMP phosphodiesterase class II)